MNISVYVLDITQFLDEDVLMRYMASVTAKRREKAERFKNTADKARCIGAGILLAYAYNHYQNIQRESAGAGSLVVLRFSEKGTLHMCDITGDVVRGRKQGDDRIDEVLKNQPKEPHKELQRERQKELQKEPKMDIQKGLTEEYMEELQEKLTEKLPEWLTEKLSEEFTKISQKELPEELIDERGKPYFAQGPCFNLSHAGNRVVCVMAPFEVGIDVERVRPCRDAVMTRCYSREEIAAVRVAGSSADRIFTEIWTQKEARAKLSGKGIADIFHMGQTEQDLTSCAHTIWLDEEYVMSVAVDRQLWHL